LEISRQTGIPAQRIYKWLSSKREKPSNPKGEDIFKMIEWAKKNLKSDFSAKIPTLVPASDKFEEVTQKPTFDHELLSLIRELKNDNTRISEKATADFKEIAMESLKNSASSLENIQAMVSSILIHLNVDREVIYPVLARLEKRPESEIFQDAGRKVTEVLKKLKEQDKIPLTDK